MYKVGKVFMEEAKITKDFNGRRIVICPICGAEILLADDEFVEDSVWCDLCDTPIKIIE